MSTFKTLVKTERTKLEKTRAKLVQDRESIDSRIEAVDVELAAMDAYAEAVGSTPVAKTRKSPAPAAKAPAKTVAKAAPKAATKTATRTVAKAPVKAAAPKADAAKPSTKVEAKTAAAPAKPAAKAAPKAGAGAGVGRRDVILGMIAESEGGMSRSDLIQAMGVKGDKKQEKSISNALADLKKQNTVDLAGGVYFLPGKKSPAKPVVKAAAAAKPAKTAQLKNGALKSAQVLQMPKSAKSARTNA